MNRYLGYQLYLQPHPGLRLVEVEDGRPVEVIRYDHEVADLTQVATFWSRLYGLPVDDRRVVRKDAA